MPRRPVSSFLESHTVTAEVDVLTLTPVDHRGSTKVVPSGKISTYIVGKLLVRLSTNLYLDILQNNGGYICHHVLHSDIQEDNNFIELRKPVFLVLGPGLPGFEGFKRSQARRKLGDLDTV